MTQPPDTGCVPSSDQLLASIAALVEQANGLAVDTVADAVRAYDEGHVDAAVDHVCRLAVGAGITTGELAWLTGELQSAEPAIGAIASMRSTIIAAAAAVQDLADRGGPTEVAASAEALRRVAAQLEQLL